MLPALGCLTCLLCVEKKNSASYVICYSTEMCQTAYKQLHRYGQTDMVQLVISALIVRSPFSILSSNCKHLRNE